MPVDLTQTFAIPVATPEEEEAFCEIERRQAGPAVAPANVIPETYEQRSLDYRKAHPDHTTRSYSGPART